MLDSVTAVRFDRRMSKGRTRPCLMTCLRENGDEIEVICKFSAGCEMGTYGLAAEAVAAMIAADVNLPVPEPVAVHFDMDFVGLVREEDPETAGFLQRSVPIAFGSTKLPPGYSIIPPGFDLSSVRQHAAEIFVFDAFIQNPDRKIGNPNCLFDGTSLAIIDHELCFSGDMVIGWRPPWEADSLGFLRNEHAFFAQLSRRPHSFDHLKDAWENISAERLQEYFGALPAEWLNDLERVKKIFSYLENLHGKIDEAIVEATRVLS